MLTSVKPSQLMVKIVHDELASLMGGKMCIRDSVNTINSDPVMEVEYYEIVEAIRQKRNPSLYYAGSVPLLKSYMVCLLYTSRCV